MKKCKCLKCGGIYDLPQPKSCPACGGVKFQSYFTKDPVSPKATPAVPKVAPRTSPVAARSPATTSSRSSTTKPTTPSAAPSASKATPASVGRFIPPKAPSRSLSQHFKEILSALSGMTWKDYLKWLTRSLSVLITIALFSLVYMIPAAILGGWWWGVLGVVAVCAIVKFTVLK